MTIGIFAVLYQGIPAEFFLHQSSYSALYQQNQQVVNTFKASDLTIYSSTGSDNMTPGYTSISDAPDPPQWVTAVHNRYMEVWWDIEHIQDVGSIGLTFEVRDTEKRSFLIDYYVRLEWCKMYVNDNVSIGGFLQRFTLAEYAPTATNLSISVKGTYITATILLLANGTDTLLQSWDHGAMNYMISWEINFNAMKPSAWNLISQLLTFQSPDFGIPGLFGSIISYIIGLVFWVVIALITYTIITKLLPTVQGGLEN